MKNVKNLMKYLILPIIAAFALNIGFVSSETANPEDYNTPETSADSDAPEPPEPPAVADAPESPESPDAITPPNGEDVPVRGFITLPHSKHSELSGHPYENISLLGACDPEFPLYINGTEVSTTASGYFSFYTGLAMGDNLFRFENGGATAEITVKRITPKPPGAQEPPIIFEEPVYGIAKNTIISRFYERDDDNKLGTPLVKGTVFRIIAEDVAEDGLYRLHDGSYIFKNSADLLDPPDDGESAGQDERYAISLYSIALQEEEALVTLHGYEDGEVTEETYEIPYAEGRTVTGYDVEIIDGTPVVHISYALTDLSKAVVLIDAGHGGTDPGALGPPGEFGVMEKDFNLDVAKRTRDYLEDRGVTVIFPRGRDEHVPALERMENFAGNLDMSVSIHSNSMPMQRDFWSDEGPLMFYSMEYSGKAASALLSHITERLISGSDLAGRSGGTPKAEVRNFGLARYTGAPSMLFEMGYLCNPREYERMCQTSYLDLMAQSLGEGVMLYLENAVQEEFDVQEEETAAATESTEEDAEPENAPDVTTPPAVAEEQPAERKPFRLTLGDTAFLALVAAASLIRVIYEIKKP